MKYVLIMLFLLVSLLPSFFVNANEGIYDERFIELDELYNSMYTNKYYNRSIRDGIYPQKIKYCQSNKNDKTFTIFNNQKCREQEFTSSEVKVLKAKKISWKKFKKLNPNYNEKILEKDLGASNLVCLRNKGKSDHYKYAEIFYLNHTNENKVYLNNLVIVVPFNTKFYAGYGHNLWGNTKILISDTETGEYYHEGKTYKEENSYKFEFYKFLEKDTSLNSVFIRENSHANITLPIKLTLYMDEHELNLGKTKCHANPSYWKTMFPNRQLIISYETWLTEQEKAKEIKVWKSGSDVNRQKIPPKKYCINDKNEVFPTIYDCTLYYPREISKELFCEIDPLWDICDTPATTQGGEVETQEKKDETLTIEPFSKPEF